MIPLLLCNKLCFLLSIFKIGHGFLCKYTFSFNSPGCCMSFACLSLQRGWFIISMSLGLHLEIPSLFMATCPQLRRLRHASGQGEQVVPAGVSSVLLSVVPDICHLSKAFLSGYYPCCLFLFDHTGFAGPCVASADKGVLIHPLLYECCTQILCSITH